MTKPRPFVESAALLPPGPLRSVYRLVSPLVERACGFHALNKIYAQLQSPDMTPERFCEQGLQLLGARVEWPTDEELAPLRAWQGPLVVMANHPFGGTEALAFMLLLERIRPGAWRMFANRVLAPTIEIASRLIPVDPFVRSQASNRPGIREARRFLEGGGLLGAFPAGRVSGWSKTYQRVVDEPWSDHPARLAAAANAAVALMHVPESNSKFFLKVPMRWPRFRALFLPRQMLRADKPTVRFRIGPIMEPCIVTSLVRAGSVGAKLHARCHLISEILPVTHAAPTPPPPDIAPPGDTAALGDDLARLTGGSTFLFEQGRFVALLFQRHEGPHLFHELSRLRELTFRASGQGGGATVDVTPEDEYYHQLVLWDREQQHLVGAYRLGFSEDVLRDHGQNALYLNHVFHIQPEFFQRIGPAIELTRSFIHPDYQREPLALAMLWRGLGMAVAARPQIHSLFGSVTVPATVSDASRAIIVEHLRRHHLEDSELCKFIRPRTPFVHPGIAHKLIANAHSGDEIESLRDCIRAPNGALLGIPPLIRHYLSLNARFIDFHVEREFGNALYCLLRVDLTKAPLSHLRRFVGKEAAALLLGGE